MKRLSRNAISIVTSDAVRRFIGFVTVAYLARRVGIESFGAINVGLTVLTYALLVSAAGLGAFGARAVARGESSGIASTIVSIRLLTGTVIFGIVIILAATVVANPATAAMMVFFCLALFPNALQLDWFYQGKEEMELIGIGRLVSALLYLILIVVFVRTSADLLWVAGAAVAGDLASSVIVLSAYRRRNDSIPLRFSLAGAKSILRQSLPMGAGSVFATVSTNLPILLIGIFLSNRDAGIYGAASKLVAFLLMIDRVLGTLLLPATSRVHARSAELLSSTLGWAMKWIIVAALPICVGGTILAPRIVPLVYGAAYGEAILVFRILIWFFLFTTMHTVYTAGMIASGQERTYGTVMAISLAVYASAVVIGTLVFGVAGAAAAAVISEAVTLTFMRQRLERSIKIPFRSSTATVALSAAVMAAFLWLVPAPLFAAIALGAVVYAAVLFGSRSLTRTDISELVQRIR